MLQKIADATKVLDRVVLCNTEVKFKNPITEGPTSSGYALSPQTPVAGYAPPAQGSNPSASQRIVSNRGEYLKNRRISPHQQDNRSILRDSAFQPMESDDEDKSPRLRSKTLDGYVKSGTGFLVPKAIAGQYLDRYVLKPEGESSRGQPNPRNHERESRRMDNRNRDRRNDNQSHQRRNLSPRTRVEVLHLEIEVKHLHGEIDCLTNSGKK